MKWISSIKPLLIIAVLGGVAYGVWVRISGPPPTPPPDAPKNWKQDPIVEVPSLEVPSVKIPAGDHDPNELPPLSPYAPTDSKAGFVPKVILDPPRVPPGPNKTASAGGPTFFSTNMASAKRMLDNNEFKRALEKLSALCGSPRLSEQENRQLTALLNYVAFEVIYSIKHHLLEKAHTVAPGETLETIAQKYNVPPGLLVKINGIINPAALRAGETLKVVRGPFNARLDMSRGEITLRLGMNYAGSFPCRIANDWSFAEGNYTIEKSYSPRQLRLTPIRGGASIPIRASSPVRSTNDPSDGIQLDPNHLDDIYDILSERSSRFIIRR